LLGRLPRRSTPFPYPTLFRSVIEAIAHHLDGAHAENPAPAHRTDHNRKGADRGVFLERDAEVCGFTLAGPEMLPPQRNPVPVQEDRKSTRLNSSHVKISYAVF